MIRLHRVLLLVATVPGVLLAQVSMRKAATEDLQSVKSVLEVRTFTLKYLDPEIAAQFISPYVDHIQQGGVFKAGAVRGVTVRAYSSVMWRVDSLLKATDREPASVRLRFQVVAAIDSSVSADPNLGGIEEELRSVLRFRGYRLLAQGVISTAENRTSEITLSDANSSPFLVNFFTDRVDGGDRGTVKLNIALQGWPFRDTAPGHRTGTPILSTSMTMPINQSVVVGSGSGTVIKTGSNEPRQQVLLLVVRAEPVAGKP